MACSILLRTIGGVDDKRAVMSQAQFGRVLTIGTDWTNLRIGIRYSLPDSGANILAPTFFMGVCSGTTAMIADATTTNFVGLRIGNTSTAFTRGTDANSKVRYTTTNLAYPVKRVNTTTTAGSSVSTSNLLSGDTSLRFNLMAEIAKGSPNYNIKFFVHGTVDSVDISQADFLDLVAATTPVLAGYTWNAGPNNIACDEAAGAFDTVNLYWDKITPGVEVSDIAIARIA